MDLTNKAKERLEKLGVEFPLKGTRRDLELVLKTFVMEKEIDITTVKEYFSTVKPSIQELVSILSQLSKDQSEVSKEVFKNISKAIDVLKEQLDKDISPEERKMTYDLIAKLIDEARRESDGERGNKIRLGMIAFGGIVITAGVLIFIVSRGNTEIINKGLNMATEGYKNNQIGE